MTNAMIESTTENDGKRPKEGVANSANDQAVSQNELVFAIAHEIGNHLGAIRLHAHLIAEDLDARSLARSSIEIEALAGRTGRLLALLRPILSPESRPARRVRWSGILAGLRRQLDDEGTRGITVVFDDALEVDLSAPAVDWLHALLMALLEATLAGIPVGHSIRLGFESHSDGIALIVEDDGIDEDLSSNAAMRGRPLAVAIARRLVAGLGGRLETVRTDETTRVVLIFPIVDRTRRRTTPGAT